MSHAEFVLRVAKIALHAIGITLIIFAITQDAGFAKNLQVTLGGILFLAGSLTEFFADLQHH